MASIKSGEVTRSEEMGLTQLNFAGLNKSVITRHEIARRLLAISKEYDNLKDYEQAVMEYQKELEA